MRARLTGAPAVLAVAATAALAPSAGAQTPTAEPSPSASPTPTATATPTPTPTPEEQERAERDARDRKAKKVRRIYRDFERDGRIDDCDHPRRALVRTRRSIADSYEEEYPDFRDALTAAIQRHDDGKCVEEEPPTDAPPAAPPATPPPAAPPATPPPAAPPPPPATSTPESGELPDFGGSGGSGSGGDGGSSGGEIAPLPGEDAIPEGTASPEPTPAATPTAPPEPRLIVTKAGADPNMFVPGTMLAIALVGLLLAALSAFAARRSERFAGVAQAWREAAWRTSGTWNDFTDWLRLGR